MIMKIVWDDETETEIHPPKVTKKEFEPIDIHEGCFKVSVKGDEVKIETGSNYMNRPCFQSPRGTRKFICALESAIDYIEGNK